MAEQAHFAKYKISLKNNNKESQQVNEPTRTWGARNSKIRFLENSRIQEFVEVDRQKKEEKSAKISPPYSYSITSFLFSCQFLNTVNPKIGLVAIFLVPKWIATYATGSESGFNTVIDIHIVRCKPWVYFDCGFTCCLCGSIEFTVVESGSLC